MQLLLQACFNERVSAPAEKRFPIRFQIREPYLNFDLEFDQLTINGIHAADTLRYLCGGKVEAVASSVRRIGSDQITFFQAMVKFSRSSGWRPETAGGGFSA